MSNSPSFPNMPSDKSLPDIGMYNPDPNTPNQSAGGATKIKPTSKDGASYQGTSGYGFMVNSGPTGMPTMAPSGENSSGIPAAQPIDPITFGDPNDTAVDANDSGTTQGTDIFRRGFN